MNSNYDTAILFTHQSRMLCFLESLGVDTTIPVTQDKKEQIRFKNGAIVKLEILKGGELQVSLVYAGELAEDKHDLYYFDNEKPDNIEKPDKKYIPIEFPKNVSDDIIHRIETTDENNPIEFPKNVSDDSIHRIETTDENNIKKSPKKNIEFIMIGSNIKVIYLVRHGQAEHNVKKGLGKWMQSIMGKKDTLLTDNGKIQAKNAGKHFFENVYTGSMQKLFVGVSYLKRTSETAAYFLYDKIKTQNPLVFPYLHVIPCSHEIKQKKSPCDGDKNMRSNENIMDCKGENAKTESCNSVIVTGEQKQLIKFTKNWEYYDSFYALGRRSGLHAMSKSSDDEKLCRNTNMIVELLKCAESMGWKTMGGKSHKRKSKRLASKRKTKKRNRRHTKK